MNITQNTPGPKRSFRAVLCVFALVGLLLVSIGAYYIDTLRDSMKEETNRYLQEIAHHVSSMVNDRIESTFTALEAIADTYPRLSEEKRPEYFREMEKDYGFLRLLVLDETGRGETLRGTRLDLGGQPFLKAALEKGRGASGPMISTDDGQEVIIFAVPLYLDGELAGVVAASNTTETLRNTLNVESFGGAGFCHIIDINGDFVVRSPNPIVEPIGGDNYFAVLEQQGVLDSGYSIPAVKEDIAAGLTGILYFSLEDGIHKAMAYVPLEMNQWYLLSVVPINAAGVSEQKIIQQAIFITICVVLAFLALILVLMSIQRRNQRRLWEIAYVDPVTGGMSQAWFNGKAEALIRNATPGTYALASLDIRQFKLMNDLFGSQAGDRVLRHLHDVIRTRLKQGELVSRIAADTLYLLLKGGNLTELRSRLTEMAEAFNAFNREQKQKYFLPISVGVYVIDEPKLSMIAIQDRANVARKRKAEEQEQGLCRCAFYSGVEQERLLREKEIANRMETALAEGEFEVYLQPKVALKEERVAGAEALVRWRDPERGLVPPNDFIPVMERNGFIVRMDLYVFEQVCGILRRWLERGIEGIPVSVNLSRAHLRDSEFLKKYQEIQRRYGVPGDLIELELTETLVFENLEALKKVVGQIHDMGFRFAMDDFGSGYSSLNVLKDVSADVLKLDREFFVGEQDARSRRVVEGIIGLARNLKMRTVAEGVERMEQMAFLREAGCDLVQGYVFSKPISLEEFERRYFGWED